MKRVIIAAALAALLAGQAFASEPVCATCTSNQSSAATNAQSTNVATGSEALASNAGNNQSITFTSPGETTAHLYQTVNGSTESRIAYSGTQTIKNVPSVNGPPLVSSNDTCMGSASGSISVAGFGGGFGKTYLDDNCVMLKNSRELWNMGMRAAALARMCMDSDNRDALETTGFECPQTAKAKKAKAEEALKALGEPTDPLVRARLGLADIDSYTRPVGQ